MRILILFTLMLYSFGVLAEPLYFYWNTPNARENGSAFTKREILYYVIEARSESDLVLYYKLIPNRNATSTVIVLPDDVTASYYQIAVVDRNGLHSQWVRIIPRTPSEEETIPEAPIIRHMQLKE